VSVLTGQVVLSEYRQRLRDLYDDYTWLLDRGDLDGWLELFTGDCLYRIMARENFVRGLPLATMRCESLGMLADRVAAIRNTQFYAARVMRRLVTGARVTAADGPRLSAAATFVVIETLDHDPTHIHMAGEYHDVVVDTAAGLRFAEKTAVYDSPIVPTSLIYPI
jgi:3-phenylpropionate/cinnamic acid dioxygenase small subunit